MISLKQYEEKKKKLIHELKSINGRIALKKETSNLFRSRKQDSKKIDVRNFNNVISVDKRKRIAEVEGMCTFENFVDETLKFGMMPAVVPELKTITIGGAVTGCGIESSSFKFGLVHDTVSEMEIILGDGKIITCSPEKNLDLFFGFPNSYGTLGYALKLKVKLVPVKRYVKITHKRYDNAKKYFKDLDKTCKQNYDFVDGVVFSEKEMYMTSGRFTDNARNVSDYKKDKLYFKSIREKAEDFLTIKDYIWRWDTDWFWCSKVFGVQNKIIRKIWGYKHLGSKNYFRLMRLNAKYPVIPYLLSFFGKRESVIQDIEVPAEKAEKFLNFFQKNIGIKPIWICPVKTKKTYPLYSLKPGRLYVNFGFWDSVPWKKDGYYNRLIEKKVAALGGKKSLYSSSYYPEKEFWRQYNKKAYFKLKRKYDPGGRLLNLYEKCVEKK